MLRLWANSPIIGSEVARFSRKYFFSGAVLAYCIISAYAWAGFPYDNLCIDPLADVKNRTGAAGIYNNVTLLDGETVLKNVTIENDTKYRFCRQNWIGYDGLAFPPTSNIQWPNKMWMSTSQEQLTNIFGYTSVVAVAIYFIVFFGGSVRSYIVSWVRGVYQPRGQEQQIDFSSDSSTYISINTYIVCLLVLLFVCLLT